MFHTYYSRKNHQLLKKILTNFKGRVIDFGCGQGQMKQYLPEKEKYTGIDLFKGKNVDLVCDIKKVPIKDNSFDAAICNAVLEHVENPEVIIKEIIRVTKPGAKIFISIPFLQHYHPDPEDFRRYTAKGLEKICQDHNLKVVNTYTICGTMIVKEFLLYSSLVYIFKNNLFIKKWYLLPYYFLIAISFLYAKIFNYLFGWLQKNDKSIFPAVNIVCQNEK